MITRLFVKYEGNRYGVYDEKNCFAGRIRKRMHKGIEMEVLNAEGELEAFVWKSGESLMVQDDKGKLLSCSLGYRTDAEGHGRLGAAMLRPPMAERICLDTVWGALTVLQKPTRDFEIFLEDAKVGELRHMLRVKKEISIFSKEIPVRYYSVIFSLGFLMLHDDDIELV